MKSFLSRFFLHIAASAGIVLLSVLFLYRATTALEGFLSTGLGLFLLSYIHHLSRQRESVEEDRDRMRRLLNDLYGKTGT